MLFKIAAFFEIFLKSLQKMLISTFSRSTRDQRTCVLGDCFHVEGHRTLLRSSRFTRDPGISRSSRSTRDQGTDVLGEKIYVEDRRTNVLEDFFLVEDRRTSSSRIFFSPRYIKK